MVIYLSTLFRKLYLRNFNCFSIYPPQATGCVFIKLYLFANKSSGEHQEPTTYKLFCLHIQQSIPSNRSFCKSSTYKDQSCLFITNLYHTEINLVFLQTNLQHTEMLMLIKSICPYLSPELPTFVKLYYEHVYYYICHNVVFVEYVVYSLLNDCTRYTNSVL